MRSSKAKPVAVVLVGHGSKTRGFDTAMRQVVLALKRGRIFNEVRCAFLEAAEPSIPDAIDRCVERGAREVRVLPYFVLTGKHVTRDIPKIIAQAVKCHRNRAKIVLCPYLGYHSKIVSVVKERLKAGR